ncbi:MAG TPA: tail fiber protein [Verrucomicrobiales bacterium]|nr:tail fiber protein [Verrucomicrobiales bacterium]HIL71967.1 tail fiber protein [Verrucomicrobiota bacterium]
MEGLQEGINEKISGFETGFNSKIGGLAERQESLEGSLNKMDGELKGQLSSLADSQKQSDKEIANTVDNLAKSTLGRLDELAKRVIASSSSVEREIGTLKSQKVPVGTILPFGAKINSSGGFQQLTEAGWLLCNGNTLSRDDYAPLFKAIGSSWGAGDSTSTFNLPDLNNKGLNPEGEDTSNSSGLSWIIRVR